MNRLCIIKELFFLKTDRRFVLPRRSITVNLKASCVRSYRSCPVPPKNKNHSETLDVKELTIYRKQLQIHLAKRLLLKQALKYSEEYLDLNHRESET